jgi:serine/threonine protein phosphatase 1
MPRELLKRWLSRRPRVTVQTACLPAGTRVYAIGDIHGRIDLLRRMHQRIRLDAATAPADLRLVVVYLGDYVDRGLYSREVLDLLLDEPLPGFQSVHLRGNHDHEMAAFLAGENDGSGWLRYGGDATLYSYGVRMPTEAPAEERLALLRDRFRQAVPARHVAFLESMPLSFELGDYLFVHAGVDPEKPLDRQTAADLLWIRDAFLEADVDFGKVVVHGHSVVEVPEVRENRIGIDTGACYTNVLTCLVIDPEAQRFLHTGAPDLAAAAG